MKERILIAGHGGQGVLFAGYVLANGLICSGWHVVAFPAYGVQMRGGTANIWVICSTDRVASPICSTATALLAMNQLSFVHFSQHVEKDGTIIVNSTLVEPDRSNNNLRMVLLPATEIAAKLSNERLANMVMLGGLCAYSDKLVNINSLIEGLNSLLKDKNLIELNKKALVEGFKYVSQIKD